jgi:hypothetical protein
VVVEERTATDEPQYCYLTTTGRKTRRPHTIEIWFTAIGSTIYLISGGRDRSDWIKNLLEFNTGLVRFNSHTWNVVARTPLALSPERDNAVRKLHEKYGSQVSRSLDDWLTDAYIVALDRRI